MKKILFLFAILLFSGFVAEEPATVKITIPLIIVLLTGIWEVVGRVIPSIGQITVIGKIIEGLNLLSNFFNRNK